MIKDYDQKLQNILSNLNSNDRKDFETAILNTTRLALEKAKQENIELNEKLNNIELSTQKIIQEQFLEISSSFVGMVCLFPKKYKKEGWLICDGSQVRIETYKELYESCFSTNNEEDEFFNLPNLNFHKGPFNYDGDTDNLLEICNNIVEKFQAIKEIEKSEDSFVHFSNTIESIRGYFKQFEGIQEMELAREISRSKLELISAMKLCQSKFQGINSSKIHLFDKNLESLEDIHDKISICIEKVRLDFENSKMAYYIKY